MLGRRFLRTLRPAANFETQVQAYPAATREALLENVPAKLDEESYHSTIIGTYLAEAQTPADLDRPFWRTARQLARSARTPQHLELFGMLFEAAKQIEEPELKQNMLYEVGRYIYRQKKVRLDPVNEVEFLDALVAKGRAHEAVRLWELRKPRENTVYWQEMGVLFYLDAGLIHSANDLALELTEPASNRVVTALVGAWCYFIGRFPEARRWLEHWTQIDGDYLPALLSARQWDLAFHNLAHKASTEQIEKALERAVTTVAPQELDFLPLFEQLLEQGVDATILACSAALSLARRGDAAAASALLTELDEQLGNATIPRVFAKQLAEVVPPSSSPQCLRRSSEFVYAALKHAQPDAQRKMWEGVHEPSEKLILRAMRLQILSPAEMFKIADERRSSNVWTMLWYLLARGTADLDKEKCLSATLKSPLTAQILVYIAQSIPKHRLVQLLSDPEPVLSKPLANLFVKSVNSAARSKSAPRRPRFGNFGEPIREVSMKDVAARISKT